MQSTIEIIPSINVRTFEEVEERIKKVEPYVKWVHLDITDGIFSKHLTWHDPRDLLELNQYLSRSDLDNQGLTLIKVEVHLMVQEPEKILNQWLVKPIKRVIVHLEAAKDLDLIIQKCREAGIEIGLALKPETFWGKLRPWFEKVDMITALEVNPGPSAQPMAEDALDKIAHIRKSCPQCIIEADGGINPETAKKAVQAGANLLVTGNYIFGSADIKQAIETLRGSAS